METRNSSAVRWGILGPGSIAKKFVEDLRYLGPDAAVVAVGSRSTERAESFSQTYDIPNWYGSYEELAADPEVDAIYVATPHPLHREHAILALRGGKHVLCEKPFTVNAGELAAVIAVAKETGQFLMEAHWTRFLPALAKVRELISEGAIGEVQMLHADFGFRAGVNPEGRLFKPSLGGGALLDVGCYCVSLAAMLFGPDPVNVVSTANLGSTGVDEQAAMVLTYPNGGIAVLSTAIRTNLPNNAVISGTEGRITLPGVWGAKSVTVTAGGKTDTYDFPYEGSGKQFEAGEIARCVRDGRTESDIMPLDESLAIMRTMDTCRAQWGLKYPME